MFDQGVKARVAVVTTMKTTVTLNIATTTTQAKTATLPDASNDDASNHDGDTPE